MRRLIINADDFGLAPSVNEAIIACLEAGRLSSTTLMVNGPAAREAMVYAKSHPPAAVGLHLNLVHFSPLSHCPALSGPAGFLGFAALIRQQFVNAGVLYAQARTELEAQLAQFHSSIGRLPSHIDSHLWTQVLPAVFQAIIDVAAAHGISGVRNIDGGNPVPALHGALRIGGLGAGNLWRSGYQTAKAGWFNVQSRWCRYPERLRSRGLFTPQHYLGVSEGLLYRDVETRLRVIEGCLQTLPADSISEFMVHPGGPADPRGVRYNEADARIETHTLLSDRLPEVLARTRVRLLAGYGPGN